MSVGSFSNDDKDVMPSIVRRHSSARKPRPRHPADVECAAADLSPARPAPDPDDRGGDAAPRRNERLRELHLRYAADRGDAVLAELVDSYAGLVTWLAHRHAHRHDRADYEQVAYLALIKALRRFDPSRGVAFSTFAYATISGELKRATRDTSWAVRVSRDVQERYVLVGQALEDLTQRLGRAPTFPEIAAAVGCTDEDVVEAIDAGDNRNLASLEGSADRPRREPVEPATVEGNAITRLAVDELLAVLSARERRIIELRFIHDCTQAEIAGMVGISQMHVSRLLRTALNHLRAAAAHQSRPCHSHE